MKYFKTCINNIRYTKFSNIIKLEKFATIFAFFLASITLQRHRVISIFQYNTKQGFTVRINSSSANIRYPNYFKVWSSIKIKFQKPKLRPAQKGDYSGINIIKFYKQKNLRFTCYALVYLMANLFGVYHQILTGISQEDAYKNTIKFIDGRMKLEREKQQQEMLIVSVLPAHIALEMKTEMLRKTCKAQMKSMLDSEKFYSQNENNVS